MQVINRTESKEVLRNLISLQNEQGAKINIVTREHVGTGKYTIEVLKIMHGVTMRLEHLNLWNPILLEGLENHKREKFINLGYNA